MVHVAPLTEMTRVVWSLAPVLLILGAGWSLTGLSSSLARRPAILRAGWAWILGAAWVGTLAYAGSHVLGLPLRRATALALMAIPVAARCIIGVIGRRHAVAEPRTPRPGTGAENALCSAALVLGTLITLGLLGDAVSHPVTDWDGRMTWQPVARFIQAEHSVDSAVLRDPRTFVAHPRYPVLMPVLQALTFEISGGADDRSVRPIYAAFYPALLLVLFDAVASRAGNLEAALATLAAISVPYLAWARNGGASGTYSDLPLACFFGAGLLLLSAPSSSKGTGWLAGLLLAAAVLTKNEGVALAGAAIGASVVGMAILGDLRSRRGTVAAAATLVVLAAVVLSSWRAGIPNRYDPGYEQSFSLSTAARQLAERLPLIVTECARRMMRWADWGLLWPGLLVAAIFGWRRESGRRALVLLLGLAGALVLYIGAYSIGWNVRELIETTWDRFLLQMILPLLTVWGLALSSARGGGTAAASEPV